MKQDTIILTFSSPDQKEDFLKDTKIEKSSIFLDKKCWKILYKLIWALCCVSGTWSKDLIDRYYIYQY